jgi:hypothetical protein
MTALFGNWRSILTGLAVFVVIGGGLYTLWNESAPQKTCASCHEIEHSSSLWAQSGHRAMHCRECHGTAVSSGWHAFKERAAMVLHHFTGSGPEAVRLQENDISAIVGNCKRCHESQYAGWLSGGHSATYEAIFLNEKHNTAEQPQSDCLRCHGMFFEGSISDLVTPLDSRGPWRLLNPEKAGEHVIPCLTCHMIHRQGLPASPAVYSDPKAIFYARAVDSSRAAFFDRYEQRHFDVSLLPRPVIMEGNRTVDVADDPLERLCVQCHAPNAWHQAGSADDRTPRGVHEGLSCRSCHEGHDNNPRRSCVKCHPAVSNCGLDVATMNTTYAKKESPHNIHSVACADCHPKGIPTRRQASSQ